MLVNYKKELRDGEESSVFLGLFTHLAWERRRLKTCWLIYSLARITSTENDESPGGAVRNRLRQEKSEPSERWRFLGACVAY
jgi:hypothetical protein